MPDFMIGDTARIPVNVTSVATSLIADPGGLLIRIKKPDGTVTVVTYGSDAALIKDSVGNYHVDQLLDQAGLWRWRWEATAPNQGVVEGALNVIKSAVI